MHSKNFFNLIINPSITFATCSILLLTSTTKLLSQDNASKASTPETKATMHSLFESITTLIPLSYDEDAFKSRAKQEEIEKALKNLSENAAKLGTHAAPINQDNLYAGRSLAEDIKNIERKFARGRYDEARYLLSHITESCITCHSKLPAENSFRAESFFKDAPIEKQSPLKRASLQTALRDFSAAKKTYESVFADTKFPVSEMILNGAITDYMMLNVRVQYDPKRASDQLSKLLSRKDIPSFLVLDIKAWKDSLDSFPKILPKTDLLNLAKEQIAKAQKKILFPMDRKAYVDYVYASGLLHSYVDSEKKDKQKLGEAFYWLGVTEAMIGRSFWLSETEYFLESSIRLAPHTSYAEKSFALLEEHALLEYSGSSGTYIPQDVVSKLETLKSLSVIKGKAK